MNGEKLVGGQRELQSLPLPVRLQFGFRHTFRQAQRFRSQDEINSLDVTGSWLRCGCSLRHEAVLVCVLHKADGSIRQQCCDLGAHKAKARESSLCTQLQPGSLRECAVRVCRFWLDAIVEQAVHTYAVPRCHLLLPHPGCCPDRLAAPHYVCLARLLTLPPYQPSGGQIAAAKPCPSGW